MNRQITRLAVTGVGLLVAVIVATTYWQTWAVAGLNDRQDNAIRRVAEFAVDRGEIRGRFGKRLYATNVKRRERLRIPHIDVALPAVGEHQDHRSCPPETGDYRGGFRGAPPRRER